MRTRYTFISSPPMSSKSGEYFSSASPMTTTPRTKTVWNPLPTGHWEVVPDPKTIYTNAPAKEDLYEVSSSLGLRNTRDSWNPFEHYKRTNWYNMSAPITGTWLLLGSPASYDRVSCVVAHEFYPPNAFGPQALPTSGLPVLLSWSGEHFIAAPATLNELVSRSLKAMLPGIKPQLSLVNSVIELKDFKKLPATVRRVRSMIKALAGYGNKPLRKILGGSADAYLQKEFNVMPLLSDISGFRKALINTSKQVKNLLDLENKPLTRHFYAGLESVYPNKSLTPAPTTYIPPAEVSSEAPLPGGGTIGKLSGLVKPYREVTHGESRFHAEIQYSYYLTAFQRENSAILGLADSLGINLNPSIIWNAIPWTFVVDWVINISRWLDGFKVRNLEPVTVIHRYLWSTTVDRITKIDCEINLSCPTLPKPLVRTSVCREQAYRRDLYPIGTSHITTSGFSLKEFTLAGALGLSRVH
jgi:hypothetical protein